MDRIRIVLLIMIAVTGCRQEEIAQPVTIVVSGDTAGWIVPCGCTTNQSGGLPRRAGFLELQRKEGITLAVDVGGAPGGTTEYDRLKFEAILRGESASGVVVHNLGRAEIELGAAELRRLHEELQTPWISANTTDAAGASLAEPAKILEAGNRKILLIGVVSQQFQSGKIRVSPPRQAILKTLKENADRYDHAVVLAYVPEDELRELAGSLPELDAVVGGPTGQPVPPEYPRGHVLASSATRQGKYLALLTLSGKERMQGEIVEMDGRFVDDPGQLKNLDRLYEVFRERDLSPGETPFFDREWIPTDEILGEKTCINCHEDEYRVWRKSRHASAWRSLQEREARYDPDCQRCHVTGYGLPGGFETLGRSTDRLNVACESCHGGSGKHCKNTATKTSLSGRAKEQCARCHDRENSPLFDYDVYWPKIRHGDLD